jgi:hypothetical protein
VSETKVTEPTILVLKMVDWLHGANYRAAPTEDGRGVVSGTSGFQFLIQAFESSIQFHMGLRLSKDQLTYEDCNRQNRDWRFTKVYLDNDGDLAAEMDIVLNFNSADTKTIFLESLNIWDSALGRIRQWIINRPAAD